MSQTADPSPERRAFDAQRAATQPYSVFQPKPAPPPTPPTVPTVFTEVGPDGWHRLATDHLVHPGCRFGCISVMALVFNAILWGGFIVQAVKAGPKPGGVETRALRPQHEIDVCSGFGNLFFLVVAGFGAFAALAAVGAGVNWVTYVRAGRPTLEVSAHPLRPGRTYRLRLSGFHRARLFGTTIRLICRESITVPGDEGDDTRTSDVLNFRLHRGGGLPVETDLPIAATAMHSFSVGDRGTGSSVQWYLRVSGWVWRVFPYSQEYKVTVTPEAE